MKLPKPDLWRALFGILLLGTAALAADPQAPIEVRDYRPPIRVACLGDSITFGVGAASGWSWPDQLDRMLGTQWDVRNYGHSGASVAKQEKHTIWSQKEYQNALQFHPDVVVVLLGTNDTKPENWEKKAEFPKLYKELVASFQSLSSKPRIFCGFPPYVAKQGAFGINEAGVREQIPMIQQVAADRGAGVIDVHGATENHDEFFKDNVHPSTEGAAVIAKAVYLALTGKAWSGLIPGPQQVRKDKPVVRGVENPGDVTYRETFALIASEGEVPPEELAPIRDWFRETSPEVETKIQELAGKIEEYDQLRMKYKHTQVEAEKPLYGEYKQRVAETKRELEKFRNHANLALLARVPDEYKAGFGAGWVQRYVADRLAPIASTITASQWKKIRDICREAGPAYGKINNTPERSIASVETYKRVYEQVLDGEQRKRVMPK